MLDSEHILRVLEGRLRDELTAHRGGDSSLIPPAPWSPDLPIGDGGPDAGGLGADSLERLTLASAINELFHIHESGQEDLLLTARTVGAWVELVRRTWGRQPVHLTFRTSGSTGEPRRFTHKVEHLMAEAAYFAASLKPTRILSAVPAHHIYGFIHTVLVPTQAKAPVVDIRDIGLRAAEPADGDVIVSFPDHWSYLLRSGGRLPAVTGISSTAPLTDAEAEALLRAGLSRLVRVYGSSETAGIAVSTQADGHYRLLPWWHPADPPDGVGPLRIQADDGRTAATPDLVEMLPDGAFRLMGRVDGAVQVGGINVYPARVARHLETHPLVAAARVRQMPVETGGRLKALIVPAVATDSEAERRTVLDALHRWIADTLPTAERPRSLTLAPQLPRTAMGKDADWTEHSAFAAPDCGAETRSGCSPHPRSSERRS